MVLVHLINNNSIIGCENYMHYLSQKFLHFQGSDGNTELTNLFLFLGKNMCHETC